MNSEKNLAYVNILLCLREMAVELGRKRINKVKTLTLLSTVANLINKLEPEIK